MLYPFYQHKLSLERSKKFAFLYFKQAIGIMKAILELHQKNFQLRIYKIKWSIWQTMQSRKRARITENLRKLIRLVLMSF